MKVYILSLGCARNLVDSEVMAGALREKEIEVTQTPNTCDVAVVNTCSFIKEAREESIDTILELAELKKTGRVLNLIVTGCLPQRYGYELKNEIKEIDAVFGSSDFIKIPSYIEKIPESCTPGGREQKDAAVVSEIPRFLYNERSPRTLFTPSHFAYVKIQEGCKNRCSYCTIPSLRGPYRSRSIASLVKEVKALKKRYNVSEINLIGQDTTLFGIDRYKKASLAGLLKRLVPIMENRWIRILYTHPAHYDDELIDVVAGEEAVVKYLDLPIQHISERILRKMNRHIVKKKLISLIEKLRRKIPDLAIRTTVMVGFPGESDKEFEELLAFIKERKFERLGCFMYSREDGTMASGFSRQVPEKIKKARFDEVMKTQRVISETVNKKYMGKTIKVLIDEVGPSCEDQSRPSDSRSSPHAEGSDKDLAGYIARSWMDAPEVDGCVYVRSERKLGLGDFVDVKVVDTQEYDLVGVES